MARITEEMKVQINELYYQLGVKAQVARELGISAASVTRYLIPNYTPQSLRRQITCDAEPSSPAAFIEQLKGGEQFSELTKLTAAEQIELEELRKEIYQ